MKYTMRLLTSSVLIQLLSLPTVFGQELGADRTNAPTGVAEAARKASEQAQREFTRLVCHDADSENVPATAVPDSLLNWSNPDVGHVYGDVFLWTEQGRPVAAASIYRWFDSDLTVELCSLSTRPVVVERNRDAIWQPDQGGLEWRTLTDVSPPAKSRALRGVQLKQIARGFSAELTDQRTGDEGVRRLLRTLSRPLYRYPESTAPDVSDGALFAMVVGTDPELLLLVETEDEGWRFAVARMNRNTIDVSFEGQRLISFEHLENSELFDTSRPYCCIVVPDEQPQTTEP